MLQVLALLDYPDMLSEENLPHTSHMFPSDAIERARTYLKHIASTGAYTHPKGTQYALCFFALEQDRAPRMWTEMY